MWADHKVRIFHTGPLYDRLFTGQVEIYLKNAETGDEWECEGGRHTEMLSGDVEVVENIFLNIQYTDMMIPEGSYISNIGYTW